MLNYVGEAVTSFLLSLLSPRRLVDSTPSPELSRTGRDREISLGQFISSVMKNLNRTFEANVSFTLDFPVPKNWFGSLFGLEAV